MLIRLSERAQPPAAQRIVLLLTGTAAVITLRVVLGGADAAGSLPAAVVFAAGLAVVAVAAGLRPSRPVLRASVIGVAGGGVLFALWAFSVGAALSAHPATPLLVAWSVVVTCVAVAEEMLLRGALFAELLRAGGPAMALVVSSAVFALLHVPLYGWQALPVDAAVGLFLGGLRLLCGGIAAPAVAHALADLAAGWLA